LLLRKKRGIVGVFCAGLDQTKRNCWWRKVHYFYLCVKVLSNGGEQEEDLEEENAKNLRRNFASE
jgi:hypothetical protein